MIWLDSRKIPAGGTYTEYKLDWKDASKPTCSAPYQSFFLFGVKAAY